MEQSRTFRPRFMKQTLCCAQILALLFPSYAFAEFGMPRTSPYTFGPEGRALQDLVDFATPIKMVSFPAHQPIQSTDQYGNKLFYNTTGKLIMSVGVDGSMVTYTAGGTRSFDADGTLVQETKAIQGTNRTETLNEFGEVTGYTTKAFGGKVAQEFDADGNLLRTHGYSDYAKSTSWVRDELTQTRTIYDDLNQPQKDVDFEGNIIATYAYDEQKKLVAKTDIYGNVTSFDQFGRQARTSNVKGEELLRYVYRMDENGNNVLDKTIDMTPGVFGGDVTLFRNNMQVETRSKFGGVAQKFQYRGHTLVYAYDVRTNEVTWYNKYGRQTLSTLDGEIIREHLYYKSRFVGFIDHRANRIVLYQYERQDQEVKFFSANDMPSGTEIEKYYEALSKMNDINPTDKNPVKQVGGLVHNNTIPLTRPQTPPQRVAALNTAAASDAFTNTAKNSIVKSKYHYAGGKLQSIVSQNFDDATGVVTSIYIGPGNPNMRTSITVSNDKSDNAKMYEQLWDAVVNGGRHIGDISSGADALAGLASAIKSISILADTVSTLTDDQMCRLFGWDMAAANTKRCVEDVRARAKNAGAQGTISISYGFTDGLASGRMYAAAVAATTADAFTVGGLFANKLLDLTAPDAQNSVTKRSAAGGYIAALTAPGRYEDAATDVPAGTDVLDMNALPKAAAVQTVNGVTRGYAANGNVLYELDGQTGRKTLFDAYGRRDKVYNLQNQIVEAYSYGSDGRLEARLTWNNNAPTTTFFVGFGVAGEDQATITVGGNRIGEHRQVQQLLDAAIAGIPLADMDIAVRDLIETVNTVTLSGRVMLALNSSSLCALFGWDKDAPDTAACLQEVDTLIKHAGFDGTVSLRYDPRTLSVASISAQKAIPAPAHAIDITRYTVINPAPATEVAAGGVALATGIDVWETVSNTIGRIVRAWIQ